MMLIGSVKAYINHKTDVRMVARGYIRGSASADEFKSAKQNFIWSLTAHFISNLADVTPSYRSGRDYAIFLLKK